MNMAMDMLGVEVNMQNYMNELLLFMRHQKLFMRSLPHLPEVMQLRLG